MKIDSKDYAANKNREIEKVLEELHVSVSSSTPVWLLHNAVAAHMKVLVNSLLAMAILMAVVGTLGLTSTISMNVLERTQRNRSDACHWSNAKENQKFNRFRRPYHWRSKYCAGVCCFNRTLLLHGRIHWTYFVQNSPYLDNIINRYSHLDIDCHSGFVPGYHSSCKKSKHRYHQRSIIL